MFGFGKKKHAAEVEEAKTEEAVEAAEETTEAEEIEAEGTEADAPEVIKYDLSLIHISEPTRPY